ncbi:MAG: class I SAM-dependent methyltransferase [Pseudomonadota bacterium]
MAATAQRAIPTSVSNVLSVSATLDREPPVAEIRAIIQRPDDVGAATAFLNVLDQFDPSAPRGSELTKALVVALSCGYDAWKAEHFSTQNLRFEIDAALSADADRLRFAPDTVSLITALLHNRQVRCVHIEAVLMSLRTGLLNCAMAGEDARTDQIELAEAMARHSFRTEYIWDETGCEQDDVAALVRKVSDQLKLGAEISAFDLFMIAAYRPLCGLEAVRTWVRDMAATNPNALDGTLRLLVLDRIIEDETHIEAITPVTSQVSKEVQSQYEENPYPRWHNMPALHPFNDVAAYVASSVGQSKKGQGGAPQQAKVLIAGAGTGAHPISVAQTLPHAGVLAIDLSRASLAYATREAALRGVKNVAFAQADILKLADVDVQFDLIESVGVLHHMENPEAGLQALLKVLKPGGHLRLALYSKAARGGVNVARSRFADGAFAPGLRGIRAFRRDLIGTDDPALIQLQGTPDFFSASEFRDLVMHVQEHQFTLPQISAMLKRNGLKFLGFSSSAARDALRKMPPKMAQRRQRDLDAWDKYEKRHPDTFTRMYDFFCVKR